MIKFKTLTLRNFFSYGNQNTVIDLTTKGTTMIVGENLDDTSNGKAANGVGKTVIVNALTYAIYEQTVSKIDKIDNIINSKNKQNMYVTVVFDYNGVEYTITRARATKGDKRGKNFIEILENGKDITPAGGTRVANEMIQDMIKLPYELFVRIVVFSATNEPFLRLDSKKAREVIENLFGLTDLTQKELVLKEHIKETNNKIKSVQDGVEAKQAAFDRYTSQLEAGVKRVEDWDNTHNEKINKLIQEIEQLSVIDFPSIISLIEQRTDITNQISILAKEIQQINKAKNDIISTIKKWDENYNNDLLKYTNELEQLNKVDIDQQRQAIALLKQYNDEKIKLNHELVVHTKELKTLRNEKIDIDSKIESVTSELSHLKDNNCPYCKQLFPNASQLIKTAEETMMQYQSRMEGLHGTLLSSEQSLTLLQNNNDQLEKKIKDHSKTIIISEVDLDAINQKKITVENNLLRLHDSINPYGTIDDVEKNPDFCVLEKQTLLDNLNKELIILNSKITTTDSVSILQAKEKDLAIKTNQLQLISEETNPYTQPLQELVDSPLSAPDTSELNNLMDDLEHQKFLQKLLINKDSFVRKSLLSKSLPFLNTRLTEYLTQLGLPYKVEFTPQLTASITRYGEELDFGNLSNGQAARVNIALSLAFRDVLQQLHTPINVCILDEVLDVGLDGVGVVAAGKLLKRKSRDDDISMFIISHREEVENTFEKKLTVQMQKGFSYIV